MTMVGCHVGIIPLYNFRFSNSDIDIANKEKEMSIRATDSSKSGSSSNYCFYCPKVTVDASATLESKSKQHYDH